MLMKSQQPDIQLLNLKNLNRKNFQVEFFITVHFSHMKVDISFGNHLGVKKAEYILYFTKLEPKFRELVLIVKHWAKHRQVRNFQEFFLYFPQD